jgi:hypothetical protein
MNMENLIEGIEIKNYKVLCELLEITPSAGNTKKSQFKELDRFCKYHKEGNKYIIDTIFEEQKEKEDLRKYNGGDHNNIEYIQTIETLVLNLLAEQNKGIIFLSRYSILNKLKMINDNYSFCKTRVPKLSQLINIDKEYIYEFYDTTDGTLQRNLEKALNNLQNKCLVIWSKEITVCEAINNGGQIEEICYKDQYDEEVHIYKNKLDLNHREATDEEKQFILYHEKEVIKELDKSGKQEIIRCKLWDTFKNMMKERLIREGIIFYYDSYKIICNEEHIYEEITEIYDLLLTKSEKKNNEDLLNQAIVERLQENLQKRKNRTDKEMEHIIGIPKDEKLKLRSKENYMDNNEELIKTLIDKNNPNIKSKVKRQKVEPN